MVDFSFSPVPPESSNMAGGFSRPCLPEGFLGGDIPSGND